MERGGEEKKKSKKMPPPPSWDDVTIVHAVGVWNWNVKNDTCAICHMGLHNSSNAVKVSTCGHAYHADCIQPWLEKRNVCPLCMAPWSEK